MKFAMSSSRFENRFEKSEGVYSTSKSSILTENRNKTEQFSKIEEYDQKRI